MIFVILRNTLPALFIVWSIFFSEYFIADTGAVHNSVYYLQQLKIFISYSLLGLIIGGLSGGILAVKKKKYAYSFENDIKKYSKYFLKNFGISFLAFFSLLSREVINNPLLFKTTLLNSSFWFSGLFVFIKDKFSPLYFTVFFVIIIVMSIHNLAKTLSIYHGTKRAIGYFSALLLSVVFIFNYGFLNASVITGGKNIIFIGVENLEREHLSSKNIKEKPALKALKAHSYDFENCFTPVLDPKAVILSVLTSKNPESGDYYDGLLGAYPVNETIFSIVKERNYSAGNFSDAKFRYDRNCEPNGFDPVYPTTDEIMRSKILISHIISPVIYNGSTRSAFFPEAKLVSDYRDRTQIRENISEMIGRKDKKFLIFCTIPDYRDNLPYPYYRLAAENAEEAYLSYLNDEINEIYKDLKKNKISGETVICLFGIPSGAEGLAVENYRIPLYISSEEYEIERKVKNSYTAMDIFPTVLDAAGFDIKNISIDGRSFFDPEFIRQDILLTDISLLKNESAVIMINRDGFESKNKNIQNEIFPLLPRSLIMAEMKLNAIPDSAGIRYELYDIIKDPDEKNNLSEINPSAVKKMKDALELKLKKDLNYKLINGYVFK